MSNNFKSIDHFKFWCQKVLPLVYDDSLSYYETLCKVIKTLNDVIADINALPNYIKDLVSDERLKEILQELLNNLQEQIASANELESETATSNRVVGELVWLNGDLYRVIREMYPGDKYVTGSNIEKVTIEDLLKEIKANINVTFESDNDLATADRTRGEIIWLNNDLYIVTQNIANGNKYVPGTNCNKTTVITLINNESTSRANADNALGVRLNNEITARENGDMEINTKIDAETSARENADNLLSDRIDNEARARENTDNELDNRIDDVVNGNVNITIKDATLSNAKFNGSLDYINLTQTQNNQDIIDHAYSNVIEHNTNINGGEKGYVNSPLTVIDNINGLNDDYYHWAFLAISNQYNQSDGENCAGYFQANRYKDNYSWALALECLDKTSDGITETLGAVKGLEIAMRGIGDAPNDIKRIGFHIVSGSSDGTHGYNLNCGILLDTDANNKTNGYKYGILFRECYMDIALKINNHVSYGIDFSESTIDSSAIKLGSGDSHNLQFKRWVLRESSNGAFRLYLDDSIIASADSSAINIQKELRFSNNYTLTQNKTTSNINSYAGSIIITIDGNDYKLPFYT